MLWTGFAMSPAIVSSYPWLVTVWGGQESARTIHFLAAGSLVLFVLVHIAMVYRAGLWSGLRSMIAGREDQV
jgi:thiosulfate reductase cytochrome b subunit